MSDQARQKNSPVKSDKLFCQWLNFLPTKFHADFFSSDKVFLFTLLNSNFMQHIDWLLTYVWKLWLGEIFDKYS